MRKIKGVNTYEVWYPYTAKKHLTHVTNPNSESIDFGIHTVKEINTLVGPAMLVKGSSDAGKWADPVYTEFLIDVGQAKSDKGVGIACFFWRDKYWVKAVRPNTNQSAMVYGKLGEGRIVQYILLEVKIENDTNGTPMPRRCNPLPQKQQDSSTSP